METTANLWELFCRESKGANERALLQHPIAETL